MPADDIVSKKVPAMGVVVISAPAPGWGPENIVPAVNHCRVAFDELGIRDLVKEAGPFTIFYDHDNGNDITVNLALPVAQEPAELPEPARYEVLPEIEVAAAVRSGRAASIFPMVYQDLTRWASEHGYEAMGPGREVWIHEIDDVSQVSQQVFEIQLPFTRPAGATA